MATDGVAVGADAEVFVFDYERYRQEIVPVLTGILRGDPTPAWLEDLFRAARPMDQWGFDVQWPRMVEELQERPFDLAGHADWLGDDLRYLGEPPAKLMHRTLMPCPHGDGCFFGAGSQTFNALHEALVSTRCLGSSQFVGRTVAPDFYRPVTDGLLTALGSRGLVVGFQWEISSGILGWLTVPETRELAERLDRLDLPRYEPTFAAMAEQDRNRDWAALSLSFVRTVATIAAGRGQGILWGNDVSSELWTDELNGAF
ncbi:hypothetical protein [Paractinoplanes lichenicola]|uniref:Uncharacterized protein n=1 Tax=Paractinoplanes lichenicola TaxID=2802976 RepID=A0ABS1W1H9_9ACTN|nr:hypothetical protein [Actinoplanes lichenicola]MBL7260596.1 hypothetical protein [Actinoplanes lichenicola]